jgi:methylmalonyl-CoA/ethylmalonyl-CoA epimerase
MPTETPHALHHTCFIVRDLEGTARRLSDSLGIGPWNIWTFEPTRCLVHGKESRFSFRVALTAVGGGIFELVTPHTGLSVYGEHLEQHGDGFHHICFVYPSLEGVQKAKAELHRQGRVAIQEASAGDSFEFAYFDFPEIGSAIEVLYLDVSKLPPPEAVVERSA